MQLILITFSLLWIIGSCNSSNDTHEERNQRYSVQNCTLNRVPSGFILHRSGLCEQGLDGDFCKVNSRPYAKAAPQLEMSRFKVTKIIEHDLICLENIRIKQWEKPETLEGIHVQMVIDGKNKMGYYYEFEYSQTEFLLIRGGTIIPLQPMDTAYCIQLKNTQLRDIADSSLVEVRLWITPLPAVFTYPYREPEQYTARISHISQSGRQLDNCFKRPQLANSKENYGFIAVGIIILLIILSFPLHWYMSIRNSSNIMRNQLRQFQTSDTHLIDE